MKGKALSEIMLTVLLISILTLTPFVQLTSANPETVLYTDPSKTTVSLGNTLIIYVNIADVVDLCGYDIWLSYNTSLLDVISVGPPHLLPEPMIEIIEPDGLIHIYKTLLPPEPSVSGSGTLASIAFNATASGSGLLDLFDTVLVDSYLNPIPHSVIDGSVTVLSTIYERWAIIEDVNSDRLKVETTNDDIWSTLVELYHNRSERWIGGIVEEYDNEWGFRFDPNTIIVEVFVIEVWQTTIRGISGNLNYWLGGMACVAAKVVEISPLRVPVDYPTIQEAINAASDGSAILVGAGTYYESVIVNKTVSLIGEGREATFIDANGNTAIIVKANGVVIEGFTVLNTVLGYLIIIRDHNQTTIRNNGISAGSWNAGGVLLNNSYNNIISGNDITENELGIYLMDSSNNTIYHNNFVNNTSQVYSKFSATLWDDGYPSGGNYWSDYISIDFYSGPYQNEIGSDGIGDTPYIIDENNRDNYPLMKPYGGPHDIGITEVTASKTVIGQGYRLNITVTMLNYGIYTEGCNITVYVNATIIASKNVTLESRNSIIITFTWNTTGVPYGNYTINAYATPVKGETDTADNTYTDGTVLVTVPGDVNGDRTVDIFDIGTISAHWYPGPPVGPLGYDANADVNGNGTVDIFDIGIASAHWGQSS